MQNLSKAIKVQLIIPIMYLLLANALFAVAYDASELRHQLIGIILTNSAFVMWLMARIQLGNAFSITPKTSFLVKTGLYSKFRHPVYYFSILAVIGIGIFLWSPYFLIVVLSLITLETIRIQKEETLLEKHFGKEYTNYKQSTWF